MIKVKELDNVGDFENFKFNWNRVLQKSSYHDIFSTWEWCWCYWKHFGKGRKLRILVAHDKEEIVGIAPLMLSKYNFLHFGKLNKMEFIGSPHSDYNSFLLLKNKKVCLKLFLDHLMEFPDWDLLELRDIPEGSVSSKIIQSIYNSHDTKLTLHIGTLCPYINLPNSPKVFENRLSRNMRKNLRRRMRNLREKFDVQVKTQHDFASVEEAMEIFFKLHEKRWRSKGKLGAFASKAFLSFHLDLAKIFDEKCWLSLYFLTVNDKPIAAVYSFEYNRKKYGYLTGFDPDYGRYGVGNLLKMHVIETCIKDKLREYDLTRDFEPYKANWATGVRKNYIARLVRKSLAAKTYDWATRSNFSKYITRKFGLHLSIENK